MSRRRQGPKPPLELPQPTSPIRTRASNKTKLVGAPDMPKPRRSHQEVVDAQAAKEQEQAKAAATHEALLLRIAELEAASQEALPSLPHPPPLSALAASKDVAQDRTEDVDDSLSRNTQDDGGEDAHDRSIDVPSDGENSGAEHSGMEEEFFPSDDGSDSNMEVDENPDGTYKLKAGNAKTPKAVGSKMVGGKAASSKTAGMSQGAGVGKRKHDGDAPPTVTVPPKKARPGAPQASSALVPHWEEVLLEKRGRSVAPTPSRAATATSRASSQASFPPTSTSSSDVDVLGGREHGYADEDDNSVRPPNDAQEEKEDLRAALRYRARGSHVAMDDGALDSESSQGPSRSKSRQIPVKDALTKVVSHSSTTLAGGRKAERLNQTNKPTRAQPATSANKSSAPAQAKAARGNKRKIKNQDVPPPVLPLFTSRFVPLVKQFLGTKSPWTEPSLNELQELYRKAVGDDLAEEHPLEEGCAVYKLIRYRTDDWRAGFAAAARQAFQEVISDPDHKEHFPDTAAIGAYAKYLLGDAKKSAPFYYYKWNGGEDPDGRLQGTIIIGALAHHVSELQILPVYERIPDYATGALTFATMAAIHVLTHYSSGEWNPPPKRPGFFSQDNYGDRVIFKDGKNVTDRRMSRIVDVIDDLDDDEWKEIYQAAHDVVKDRDSKARRKSATVAIDAEPEDEDDGLMLVKPRRKSQLGVPEDDS